MNQLVTPNLDVPAQIKRCLKYVQDAFGAPNAGNSAWYAWNQTQFKHEDRDFPTGVYFIAWFSYWGTVDGVYGNWGHVVIGKDGTFYSSPWTNKNTHDVIGSIEEVERIYKCTFVGWSEDIAGLKVIERESMERKPSYQEVVDYNKNHLNRVVDEATMNRYVANPIWVMFEEIMTEQKNRVDKANAQIAELQKNSCTTDERNYLTLLKKVSK